MTRGRHAADKMPDLITDYTGARRPAHRAPTRAEATLDAELRAARIGIPQFASADQFPSILTPPRSARAHVNADPIAMRYQK